MKRAVVANGIKVVVRSAFFVVLLPMLVARATARPTIVHDPVEVAVRGQPITILARVTDPSGQVKSVTLFYSVSKDVAPFRTPMQTTGRADTYYGTIPAEHLAKAETIYYYIEAMDPNETAQETPWYTISVRSASQGAREGVAKKAAASAGISSSEATPDNEPTVRWGTVGLIAGGAAAVVGGAFLISGGGGGGGDSSEGIQPGDYDGSVTECFTPEGGATDCASHSMTIRIDADGKVSSSTLRDGAFLEDVLRGNKFTFTVPLNDPTNGVGQIVYSGTIANDTIVGTISGEAMKPTGTGQFSGTFSATKRP